MHKRFPGGWTRPAHHALRGVSLSVEPGERVGVIGASGSGKSTLARVGLGLIRPDGGSVHLLGADTTRWSARQWRIARRHAQLLLQDPRAMLTPGLSLRALLGESVRLHRPGEPVEAAVDELLAAVELEHRGEASVHALSGGERRRAGLARVLASRPRLLVADEPTTGLDAGLKASLVELIARRAGPACAVVLISHDLPMVAWACRRVVVMHEGAIVDDLPAEALTSSHDRHPHTLALLRAAGMRRG